MTMRNDRIVAAELEALRQDRCLEIVEPRVEAPSNYLTALISPVIADEPFWRSRRR